ncbi:hypothetical protein QSV55_00945 [Macrococcus bovicus]|nr:hypothetical protein QSV55_00945 [Macrococcus bovicus]
MWKERPYKYQVSQAKQGKTRTARIEKYMKNILEGKGMNDR